jgi:RNA polymerase-binding transcription factor DksA
MTMDTKNFQKKLEEEKKTLLGELSGLGILNTETGSWETTPDMEAMKNDEADENDRADRSEDFQERTSTLNTLTTRLAEVASALQKINDKTYGKCEVCGENIEDDRLNANPAAKTCKKDLV